MPDNLKSLDEFLDTFVHADGRPKPASLNPLIAHDVVSLFRVFAEFGPATIAADTVAKFFTTANA